MFWAAQRWVFRDKCEWEGEELNEKLKLDWKVNLEIVQGAKAQFFKLDLGSVPESEHDTEGHYRLTGLSITSL